MNLDDDFIEIIDDDYEIQEHTSIEPWNILVVDDDESVHSATRIALANLTILDRPLKLFHYDNSEDTKRLLKERKDFAVILLDVVMESEDSGLKMVTFVREYMKMSECRIILRTGQPGYAPELTIFNQYDINDYRTKSELNRTRLITSITSAIRSYRQIHTISENRRGLELIIEATAYLMDNKALRSFSRGILTQLSSFLNLPSNGIVCVQKGHFHNRDDDELYISGAAGNLSDFISHPLKDMNDQAIVSSIEKALLTKTHIFGTSFCTLYLHSENGEGAVYIKTAKPPSEDDQRLLEVFASNMTACFNTVHLLEQLKHDAYNDSLTLLPNKSRFILEIDKRKAQNPKGQVVALIDISHFADVNEGLGIDNADKLLIRVAHRLKTYTYPHSFVARIRGDVFGLIGDEEAINPDRLIELISKPFSLKAMNLSIQIHCGLYKLLQDNDCGETVLKNADIALNTAKKTGAKGYKFYCKSQEELTKNKLSMVQHLHDDFSQEKLELWYQPQINLTTNEIWGIEALLRWPDGQGGFVAPPSSFIPLAEYSGLIIEIGEWVLQQACKDFKVLQHSGVAPKHVSVNVSVPQFRDPDFFIKVQNALYENHFENNELIIEITESLTIDDPDSAKDLLRKLQNLGIQISLDDFGTGYSSLSYLNKLPIDFLKIDKSFIDEIHWNKNGFVGGDFASIIKLLSDKLDLTVVAEGVETEEQIHFMSAIDCHLIQGYYFAKPMSLHTLKEWVIQKASNTH